MHHTLNRVVNPIVLPKKTLTLHKPTLSTMNDFTYYAPTAYTFGRDAEKQAGTLSARYLGNKVLIVIGGGSVRRSGLLDIVTASLSDAGVAYGILEGIRPNPVDGPVRQGIEIVREGKFTGLLAVGGGSVIDTAKAIALGALYDGDFWDFYCGKAKAERALPVGVVLTIRPPEAKARAIR